MASVRKKKQDSQKTVTRQAIRAAQADVSWWDAGMARAAVEWGRRWLAPHRSAIDVAARFAPAMASPVDAAWFPVLYGRATDAHAFGHRPNLYGFRVLEPHYTRILGAFMQPGTASRRITHARAWVFVESVLTAAGVSVPAEGRPAPGAVVSVAAEARVSEGVSERLDLLFVWRANGEPWALGIEVKFGGYKPTVEQLAAYDVLIVRSSGGSRRRSFRVLLTTAEVKEELRGDWTPLRWRTLLRHWETAIAAAADNDPTYASFRAALWHKALPE